ncbi:4447_t:CDS:10 [Acaulospora morrowiae]|uniref:4447_t:CDS:1 n=1 Tax=Acaulospora morrowiae TaxID=94023 RepID=A0A9N8V5A0_9GLOM|nr:4447_t:CDS:10 [Acaulospora morrowiae]
MNTKTCSYTTLPTVITISLFFIFCKAIEFQETQPGLQIYNLKTYGDGTVLVNMINPINGNCTQPSLYFRLIHPNGTLESINLNVTAIIPDFNFCRVDVNGISRYYMDFHPLMSQYIFVTYLDSEISSSASVYGILISWKGEIISSNYLSAASATNDSKVLPPGEIHFSRTTGSIGLLYTAAQPVSGDIWWSLYSMPTTTNDRRMTLQRSGVAQNNGGNKVKYVAFPTASGEYCLVVARSFNLIKSSNDSEVLSVDLTLEEHLKIYANFISSLEIGNIVPILLYSSPVQNLDFFEINCDTEYSGLGNMCQFYFVQNALNIYDYSLKITFLSTGAVDTLVTNKLDFNVTGQSIFTRNFTVLDIWRPSTDLRRRLKISNCLRPLPQPFQVNSTGDLYGIQPNNSIVYAQQLDTSSWSLESARIPNISMSDGTSIYFLPDFIVSTYPPIGGLIPLRLNSINITYKQPVTFSTGNIKVFQLSGAYGESLLRQAYSASSGYCNQTTDFLTITCQVLGSTFNQPDATYYVVVESDFVRINSTSEPLLGILEMVWRFTTDISPTEGLDVTTRSVVRLNTLGSEIFENLTNSEKTLFIDQLNYELSVTVPVNSSRLSNRYIYQRDPRVSDIQVLLPLTITNAAPNTTEEGSKLIAQDIDALIKSMNITLISKKSYAHFLDSSFGVSLAHDLWQDYRYVIIAFIASILLLTLLFLIIHFRNSSAVVGPVLKFLLSLLNLVMNLLFTLYYARAVKSLYLPSLIILIGMMTLREAFGLFLIRREIDRNSKLHNWWKKHRFIVSFFTSLSFVDIYSLEVLSSQITSSQKLHAPFSPTIRGWIYWVEFIAFFTNDVTLFVIQIIYYIYTLHLDILPFLCFISSSAVIIFNILWRTNHLTLYCRRKKDNHGDPREVGRRDEHDSKGKKPYIIFDNSSINETSSNESLDNQRGTSKGPVVEKSATVSDPL